MSVGTNTSQEEVDTAYCFNGFLIIVTFLHKVGSITVEDVYIFLLNVDMTEEIRPHERMVALRMIFRKVYILVHVERDDVLEGDLTGFVHLDECAVETERRRTGRTSEYKRMFLCWIGSNDAISNVVGCPSGEFVVIGFKTGKESLALSHSMD